jgi:hypothetical protein
VTIELKRSLISLTEASENIDYPRLMDVIPKLDDSFKNLTAAVVL